MINNLIEERQKIGENSMGMHSNYDCFSAPYSVFHKFRTNLAKAARIKVKDMKHYGGKKKWNYKDPLTTFMLQSDCDGFVQWEDCWLVAKRIEQLLPKMKDAESRGIAKNFVRGFMQAHKDRSYVRWS